MAKLAPGTKEGEGTVRINFEPLETLLEYKDVCKIIAKQILLVRRVLRNKLNKNDFHTYGLYKKGYSVIRHFDFKINPDDKSLEQEDFDYLPSETSDDTELHSVNENNDQSTSGAKSKHFNDQISTKPKHNINEDLPPNLYFDGKGDLESFKRKFKSFVEKEDYDSKKRFSCLKMILGGTAYKIIDHFCETRGLDNDVDAFLYLKDIFIYGISPPEAIMKVKNDCQKDRPPSFRSANDFSQMSCHNCGLAGHYQKDCQIMNDPKVNGSD